MYWRSTLILFTIGMAISFAVALRTKRDWLSDTTVLYRPAIRTGNPNESPAQVAARLGPKLKDMLSSRARLSALIEEFDLFPLKRRKSMLEAVEEMESHVGFRARNSDTFVISFVYDDPVVAERVTAKLAEVMIADYNRENLDAATLTSDFLQREALRATKEVEDTSRGLATFLAENPQFQWGLNESPYAPQPTVLGVGAVPGPPPVAARRVAPTDPQMSQLEQRLGRVDRELSPPLAGAPAVGAVLPGPSEAQQQRASAAAALEAAQRALAEKLLQVTPAHPDAILAKSRVDQAQAMLATAEARAAVGRPGAAPPDNPALDPTRRQELLGQRATLIRQIAARRAELAGQRPILAGREPKAAAAKVPNDVVELETEWHRRRLELERSRERLRVIQASARQAELSADAAEKSGKSEMQVLDPAYVPTRPARGRGRVFFVGIAMVLCMTLGLATTRVLLDDTLYDEADVEALHGPPMLVAIPRLPARRDPVPRPIAPSSAMDPEPPDSSIRPPPPSVTRALPRARSERRHLATIRFGMLDVYGGNGLGADPSSADPPLSSTRPVPDRAALTIVDAHGAALSRLSTSWHEDSSTEDVTVAGVDLQTDGDVFELLRSATPALASLRVLRHRLEQRRAEAGGHLVVSVVSPDGGEGKTALATRLAMILSEAERAKVVLVEGNLDRPRLASMLGVRLPDGVGFSQQIHQRMTGRRRSWGVVMLGPSLGLLAEGGSDASYSAALHSTYFEAALKALRARYDYVVVDGPAVLGTGDANVIESASDGLILVARSGVTLGARLARAAEQLGARRILGVVLNAVTAPEAERRTS
jgi:Mrp family chromosome partitioning ATPase